MKRQVMQPFRAPRRGGKAMIRQVIKESQAIDESQGKAKRGVKALSGKWLPGQVLLGTATTGAVPSLFTGIL